MGRFFCIRVADAAARGGVEVLTVRFHALACDFDGTLATDGQVSERVIAALEDLKRSGRKLLLVTGRTLEASRDLIPVFKIFSRVVLENGAVLYRPSTGALKTLVHPPPAAFVERLKQRGVSPLHVGSVIVATQQPQETTVLEVIRELGLELHVIFNKGSVMVLPSGCNKATGLDAALRELHLSPHNVIGIGDAENDHAFLERCECAVAVQNALPSLKAEADWTTESAAGAGAVELMRLLLADDFARIGPRLVRHEIALGETDAGDPVRIPPHGLGMLIAGASGGGKSTLAAGILERLCDAEYQFCVVDPEGDYQDVEGIAGLGGRDRVPSVKEALDVLQVPGQNLALNLLGVALESRPEYVQQLLPALMGMQARTGRPHWIVIDEAHHVYPNSGPSAGWKITERPDALLIITLDPEHVAPDLRAWIDTAVFVGEGAPAELNRFLGMIGMPPVDGAKAPSAPGEALIWRKSHPGASTAFRAFPPTLQRRRHSRKYAEGDLGPDRSFRFQGPQGKLKLRAQNLLMFLQMADGVDDETWHFHLLRGEYSQWFAEMIKDPGLASLARQVEASESLSPAESRAMIRKLVEDRYTTPS